MNENLAIQKAQVSFGRLLEIMDQLRSGCPWDREQTFESLRYLTIEETYELSDAILNNDLSEVKKELGDILLHVVFYAKMGDEKQAFDMADVVDQLCEKLIRRHPHIFAKVEADTSDQVKANWEAIKLKEKGRKTVLEGVPKSLPAMVKAFRIQEKVRGVGFDWEQVDQVWDKVLEEQAELRSAIQEAESPQRIEEEFGDLLFALVNYARFINVNADDALERANKKFIRRFNYVESQTLQKGLDLHQMSLDELNVFWDAAKREEHA